MPIRRINSTGRKRILREDVSVQIRNAGGGPLAFVAVLDLSGYSLPAEGAVFVEAYRQTSFMRFSFGTVNNPVSASPECLLSEFSTADGLQFRVKVAAETGEVGLLLAEGDRIPLLEAQEAELKREPLLPVAPAPLGEEVWRLQFGGNGVELQVNERLGDWKAFASSPVFRGFVMPAVLREVLWYAYAVEECRSMDEGDGWAARWLRLAALMPGAGTPPLSSDDDEEWENWIEGAAGAFARKHGFASTLLSKQSEEGEE